MTSLPANRRKYTWRLSAFICSHIRPPKAICSHLKAICSHLQPYIATCSHPQPCTLLVVQCSVEVLQFGLSAWWWYKKSFGTAPGKINVRAPNVTGSTVLAVSPVLILATQCSLELHRSGYVRVGRYACLDHSCLGSCTVSVYIFNPHIIGHAQPYQMA